MGKTVKLEGAEADQVGPLGNCPTQGLQGSGGEKDLAPMAGVADPGRGVDREPDIPGLCAGRAPAVETYPNPDCPSLGP